MAATFSISIRRDFLKGTPWERVLAVASQEPFFSGADEGTLLTEEAHRLGFEFESWVLDSGQAPHERDWLAQLEEARPAILFFQTLDAAVACRSRLAAIAPLEALGEPIEIPEEDWDAAWRKSFVGIDVGDHFKIRPPWSPEAGSEGVIMINPGAGFGTGTHETTQLCLEEITYVESLQGKRVLDFGSGSGILAIGCATRGAVVSCVEIDPLANENAVQNARLNNVTLSIQTELDPSWESQFEVVLANILRPVLIEFGPRLWKTAVPGALFIFSGLIEEDLSRVIDAVLDLGVSTPPKVTKKGEWRAISFRKP
jgi:ribosomal protein L11 methyltransferase